MKLKFPLILAALCGSVQAADQICAPYFELINLNDDFKLSSIRILQGKVESYGSRALIIPTKDENISSNMDKEVLQSWALAHGCDKLLQGSMTRLGENVQVNVKLLDLSKNSTIFGRNYKASSPDDLEPIMGQIGLSLQDKEYAAQESIYEVNPSDVSALRKKRSNQYYSFGLGYGYYLDKAEMMTMTGSYYFDSRKLLGEGEYLVGIKLSQGASSSTNQFSLHLYKPQSDADQTLYYGGGMGFGFWTEEDTAAINSNSYYYSTPEPKVGYGIVASGSVGYLVNRTSDFQFRGQLDLNAITTRVNGKIPLGAAFRLIMNFGS